MTEVPLSHRIRARHDAKKQNRSENDNATFEALCNALVRRTVFVTGAVDMDGCPDADRGEVAFIGRSNVGKSSLVNMVRLFSLVSPFHTLDSRLCGD